ncbi:MAG: hypothetical protein GX438_02695 [Treponema sp.]|jgi:hypothetical protein|nr:hypothetical protein [Treponema sp.]
MNKYFVGTDVILDLLAARQPHFHFSAVLFTLAEMGELELNYRSAAPNQNGKPCYPITLAHPAIPPTGCN